MFCSYAKTFVSLDSSQCFRINRMAYCSFAADGACCNHKPYSRRNASCCRDVITEGVPEIAGIQECSEEQSYWNSASISCQLGIVLDSYAEVQCCGNGEFDLCTSPPSSPPIHTHYQKKYLWLLCISIDEKIPGHKSLAMITNSQVSG